MTELLSADQMRALEATAIAQGDVTGVALMERAGQRVVDSILAQWPELAERPRRACVLCGSGNNGGDGFVIARLLVARGWEVRVHFAGDTPKRSADARIMHGKWSALGEVLPLTPEAVFAGARPDVIVDAVFGIGLTRPLPEDIAVALDRKGRKVWNRAYEIKTVAVDCPSGLDLDRGLPVWKLDAVDIKSGPWPRTMNIADLTVTFHAPKIGHYIGLGPMHCGALRVVDIGLKGFGLDKAMLGLPPDPARVRLVEPMLGTRLLKPAIWPATAMGKPEPGGHKYDHGHVMVFAGGVGRGGAARLAARAALRSGAGLVTVLCPPSALIENACQLNAIMLKSLPKDRPLADVADTRVSGFVLGPGMGVSETTRLRVLEVLGRRAEGAAWRDPVVVLDADALTVFQDDPDALFAQTHARVVLTPHEGEFARLFPDIDQARRREISKVDAVRRAADRAGCIVLLKGPDTVIAQPGGGAAVHAAAYGREVPWLATAGAGDVLAGLIAGLAAHATSSDAFTMTEIAAYLHVEAARRFGPGLIAEDLAEELPKVFSDWGLTASGH